MVNIKHDKKGRFVNKGGRPAKELDWDLIARLAQLQCTEAEICFTIKCVHQTLQVHCKEKNHCTFEEYLDDNRAGGKASLRRLQWDAAKGTEGELLKDGKGQLVFDDKGRPQWKILPVTPNITMQIWLGKQYLGQTDKQELAGKEGAPIIIREIEVVKS